jgi:hypothetical protein
VVGCRRNRKQWTGQRVVEDFYFRNIVETQILIYV